MRLPLHRFTLANGLRVVLSPDSSAPVVGIAVYYDVGFRSEPEGRTGFAHLFEHLMFQETVNLEKGQADRLIEGNGGSGNGSTQPDSTVYISMLPSNALELGLFLEADRMRGSRLTQESMRNQIDVVKEEINVNVNNRPYGGFPWIDLPQVMYTSFNNAHNGYGSFVDLEAATVEDAADFFDRFYAPGNAVLSVAGDFTIESATGLIERHFGSIKKRKVTPPPDCREPIVLTQRRMDKVDRLAPMPAVAVGYRVPDPLTDEFWPLVVLGDVLIGGEASRLYQRLVKKTRVAVDIAGSVGPFGDPMEMRDPTTLEILAWHPGATVEDVLAGIDAEVLSIVDDGLSQSEADRVVTSLVSGHYRQLDSVLDRAAMIGELELLRGDPSLVNDYPSVLASVTPADVVAAARRWLLGQGRAIVAVSPEPA